jgi:hypothetical protein
MLLDDALRLKRPGAIGLGQRELVGELWHAPAFVVLF